MKSCCWRNKKPSTFKRERRHILLLSGEPNWFYTRLEIAVQRNCLACFLDMRTNIQVLHLYLFSVQFRKEKKDKQQMVAKDETILALQKKLEEKEQEYQRLKQSARKRAKASAARTARKRESNKEVCISAQWFTSSVGVLLILVIYSSFCFLFFFAGGSMERIITACRASNPEWFGLNTKIFFLSRLFPLINP